MMPRMSDPPSDSATEANRSSSSRDAKNGVFDSIRKVWCIRVPSKGAWRYLLSSPISNSRRSVSISPVPNNWRNSTNPKESKCCRCLWVNICNTTYTHNFAISSYQLTISHKVEMPRAETLWEGDSSPDFRESTERIAKPIVFCNYRSTIHFAFNKKRWVTLHQFKF